MADAIKIFFDLIPRVEIICADERGVRFLFGRWVKVLNPGVCVYIPLFTKVEKLTVSTRNLGLKKQSISTKDEVSVMIESACFYKIIDIKKVLVENHDIRMIIEDFILNSIMQEVTKNNFETLKKDSQKISKKIVKNISKSLEKKEYLLNQLEFPILQNVSISTIFKI